MHITVGDGGNIEKLASQFIDDELAACPSPGACYHAFASGFCLDKQPEWSAYREPSFGHGVLTVFNATHAQWQWHRNQDEELHVADSVVFVRGQSGCNAKRALVEGVARRAGTSVLSSTA